ncbi:hypothetical protein SB748_27960 [Rhizobium sp. SIMBA_035]
MGTTMKSPWKFLVGITRRKHDQPKPDATLAAGEERAISCEPTAAPIEHKAAPAYEGLALTGAGGPDYEDDEHFEDLATLSAIAATAARKKEKSSVSSIGRERAPERRGQAVATRSGEVAPETVASAKPLDEARSLDDEILRLRVQLAKKLKVQNSQLKEMLARFND